MTAYELADQLDNVQYQNGAKPFLMYANMLRQQQNEIEHLKNANRFIQNFAEEQHQRAVALEMRELTDEEIEEFEHLIAKAFDFSTQIKVVGLDRIIRAILRKAQEK